MAVTKFNLDKASWDSGTFMIHGGYGKGKTHFGADFLRHEMANGPVLFINVVGEDGMSSAADLGLGESGVSVETYDDLREVLGGLKKSPIQALVIDSGKQVARMIARWVADGADRPLRFNKEKNEHGLLNWELGNVFTGIRKCAKFVCVLCPSDKSVDQLTGKNMWTPDFPGRNAVDSAGWFDMVFVLDAEVIGPGKVQRYLVTSLEDGVVIRTRLPRALPSKVVIPAGGGGWAALYAEIQKTFRKEGK